MFIHQYALWNGSQWVATTSSGIAELPGNDFVVSLGAFTNHTGTREEQAATFMHELGHTLGLRHGGGDNINGKPNYLSIMSYTRQFNDLVPTRRLDYSRQKLPALDERHLNESIGIGGPAAERTVFGIVDLFTGNCRISAPVPASGAIDWNMDGDTSDSNLSISVNYYWRLHPTLGWVGFGDDDQTLLRGYNDWANLEYSFRYTLEFSDGCHVNVADNEITWEIVEFMRNQTTAYFHDIAIINLTLSADNAYPGWIIYINVTVQNLGSYMEFFNLTVYANKTEIETVMVTDLNPTEITKLTFEWNTTNLGPCQSFVIWGQVQTVPGETETSNNVFEGGQIKLKMVGDVDGNGKVNYKDLFALAANYGRRT